MRRRRAELRELPFSRVTVRTDNTIPDRRVLVTGGRVVPANTTVGGSSGSHNRDQGGRPANPQSPPGSSNGNGNQKYRIGL